MSRFLISVLLMFLPRLLPPVLRYLTLVWRLTFDRRVNILLRALVPLAIVYFVWPWDLIRDSIPLIGRLDDVIILGLALLLLIKLSPPAVVDEHLGRGPAAGSQDPDSAKAPGQVVDGKARFIDDE